MRQGKLKCEICKLESTSSVCSSTKAHQFNRCGSQPHQTDNKHPLKFVSLFKIYSFSPKFSPYVNSVSSYLKWNNLKVDAVPYKTSSQSRTWVDSHFDSICQHFNVRLVSFILYQPLCVQKTIQERLGRQCISPLICPVIKANWEYLQPSVTHLPSFCLPHSPA